MIIFIYYLLFFIVEILLFVKSLKTKNTKYWKIFILVEILSIISIITLMLLSQAIFANKEFGLQTLELLNYNYIAITMQTIFTVISSIILSIMYFKKKSIIIRETLLIKKTLVYFVVAFTTLLAVVSGQQKLYKLNAEKLKEVSNSSYLLIRLAYRGIENIFHNEYEYYLIKPNITYFVFTSNQISHYFNKNLNDLSIYEDKNTNYYFADLRYSPDGNFGIKNNDEFIDISKLVNVRENDDGILVVYSDGKQLVSNTNVVLNLDENFFDNCKVRNEYGFYYGEAYSTSIYDMKITYIFYEDGSMETYCDDVFGGCGDSGYAQYEYKKIDLDGLLFEVVGLGTEMFNGERYYELDYDFWKSYQNMETEMNEYGFYYGEAYSYFVLRNEIRSVVFYEDGSIKYYRNNELELSQPAGSIGYGYKWMRTTEDQIYINISDNGRILTVYADTPPDRLGLDPTFWERNGLVKPN